MTDAERFAWQRLRYRQFGGHKFRRQMAMGPYVLDFVSLEQKLVLELDGGQHAEQVEEDKQRTLWLEGQGFRVLRFWNNEVLKGWEAVAETIWRHLEDPGPATPHPSPPPQGGRGPDRPAE